MGSEVVEYQASDYRPIVQARIINLICDHRARCAGAFVDD